MALNNGSVLRFMQHALCLLAAVLVLILLLILLLVLLIGILILLLVLFLILVIHGMFLRFSISAKPPS